MPDPKNRDTLKDYLWERDTIVIHDRVVSASYSRHSAPFSLKTVLSGAERYNVHGFYEAVEPGDCLITNANQVYESQLEADAPVETLCVFFAPPDAREMERGALPYATLLDDPAATGARIEFPAVKQRANETLSRLIAALPSLRTAPTLRRQEHNLALLSALRREARKQHHESSRLDALKAATRDELYRRCMVGKAYIDASYAEDISLPAIAGVAGLSRTHFLRAFARYFGETPYKALRRRRLEAAASLLKAGRASVTQAALAVGYDNFSSFSRAFRAFHGVAPSDYAAT